jgi:enamine deaminase RidA (YjgF/YER057c/UK114 family)
MMMRLLTAAALVLTTTTALVAQRSSTSPTTGQMLTTGKQVITQGPNRNLPFSAAIKAGGFIYVSGTISDQGGDIRAQTKWCLEDLDRTLKAAGSSLQHAASINVYLKNAADFAAMNEVYRTFFKENPPARTTIVADLVVPEGLVEMSAVGIPSESERRAIHPKDWITSPNPYSYAIKSGDTLFLAGLIARNGKDNSVVEGDITVQLKTAMDNARQILEAAGYTFNDVVWVRNYLTDTANFAAMNKAYQTYFPKDPPARATVVAPLMGAQYLYETQMIAVKGTREAVTTPAADGTPGKPNPNLSSAIKVGNRLFVSGMLGNTADNKGDTTAQTREILARVERTLKAAGFDWTHVVDGVVYITDVKNFSAMNAGYRTIFTKDFPARATVRTGLVAPDGLVEIMFTAVK